MAPQVVFQSGSECPLWAFDHPYGYSGHERALVPLLLVLLFGGTVGGTFASVLVPPRLAIEAIEDRSDYFFTRGVAGGDVKEFLGGLWTLAS